MLDRLRLLVLFGELDKELSDSPFTELVIAGGASMAFLALDRRTKDVDVASDILPAYLREAVASVAKLKLTSIVSAFISEVSASVLAAGKSGLL